MNTKKEINYIIGEEEKLWEFEGGVGFFYREPTTREIVNYKNSVRFRRQGKDFISKAAEQQLVLADAIIVDLAGFGIKDLENKLCPLDKNTKPADIAHLKVDGAAPRSWKDLIPANLKFQFIEGLLGGTEEQEKN